jgi:hypothetical protein
MFEVGLCTTFQSSIGRPIESTALIIVSPIDHCDLTLDDQ